MKHYAQIDPNTGYTVSDSWLSAVVDAPNMILIPDDFNPSDKMYINGEWLPQPENSGPTPEPYQPTNAEVAQMISDLQVDLIIAGVI